jgi:hypothetical protein
VSYETVRLAIATHVNTNWTSTNPTVPLEFENLHEIDHSARGEPFVTYGLHYRDSEQASLENVPTTRYRGEAAFHIHIPQGRGTKPALDLADSITGFMKYAKVSNVQFLAPRLLTPLDYQGWLIWPLMFAFHYRE